jgi:alkylation response protein AidB-like acyl-CoA dehydrogenase
MDFAYSDKVVALRERLLAFMDRHIYPNEGPDPGNMEILGQFGTPAQQEPWLVPLLQGVRSGFAMTEPDVANSDAPSIQLRIERQGDSYLLNGRKWWCSGAARLLTLKAAWTMDTLGKKAAQDEIAMIKIVAAQRLTNVSDRAMQLCGRNMTRG